MKNFLFTIGFIFLTCTLVHAAPFLVCDEDSNVTSYLVTLDSGEEVEVPAPLRFDLSGISEGEHVIEVKAKNVYGESAPVPFEFIKALPASSCR